jgi:hypothetical protein
MLQHVVSQPADTGSESQPLARVRTEAESGSWQRMAECYFRRVGYSLYLG